MELLILALIILAQFVYVFYTERENRKYISRLVALVKAKDVYEANALNLEPKPEKKIPEVMKSVDDLTPEEFIKVIEKNGTKQ